MRLAWYISCIQLIFHISSYFSSNNYSILRVCFFSLIGYDLLALVKLVKLSLAKLKDIKLQTNLLTVEKTSKIFH